MESEGNIFLVEDDVKLVRFIELELQYEGYTVFVVHDGREAINRLEQKTYQLVLLDLILPLFNGFEILQRVRKASTVPAIMLTAKGDVNDKVNGLDGGADDYITRPFAIEELLARMQVIFRKKEQEATYNERFLTATKLTIDLKRYMVKWEDINGHSQRTPGRLNVSITRWLPQPSKRQV